jgi:hypothetical protein
MLFSVADPDGFYPVKAGVTVLSELMRRYGDEAGRGARPEWADKLYGGTSVREAIAGGDAARLFERWADERRGYLESKVDIYG